MQNLVTEGVIIKVENSQKNGEYVLKLLIFGI